MHHRIYVPYLSWGNYTTTINDIEMIKKKALAIILGSEYKNYSNALRTLSQKTLHARRTNLAYNFVVKCTENSRNSDLFIQNPRYSNKTSRKLKYIQPKCKTDR